MDTVLSGPSIGGGGEKAQRGEEEAQNMAEDEGARRARHTEGNEKADCVHQLQGDVAFLQQSYEEHEVNTTTRHPIARTVANIGVLVFEKRKRKRTREKGGERERRDRANDKELD